jgi:hypothetical protein
MTGRVAAMNAILILITYRVSRFTDLFYFAPIGRTLERPLQERALLFFAGSAFQGKYPRGRVP